MLHEEPKELKELEEPKEAEEPKESDDTNADQVRTWPPTPTRPAIPTRPKFSGKNSEYVKLVSNQNDEFLIKREYALQSTKIKNILSIPRKRGDCNAVYMSDFTSHLLKIGCKYLEYKANYKTGDSELINFEVPLEDMEKFLALGLQLDI